MGLKMELIVVILSLVNVVLWSISAIQEKNIVYGLFALMFLGLFILELVVRIC